MEIKILLNNYQKSMTSHTFLDLNLDTPIVMGILNCTPDSFSDGSQFFRSGTIDLPLVIRAAQKMLIDGALIIDIGGESTGPGSTHVSVDEELSRVIPVVQALRHNTDCLISVDTYKSEVAQKAIEAGADMINDVTAGRADPRIFEVVAEAQVAYCMMYAKDTTARTTTDQREYADVVQTIIDFMTERIQAAQQAGIPFENICIDPGMGAFISMNPQYSFEILENLGRLKILNRPILVGASRKSFLGGSDPKDRLEASISAAQTAVKNGADIIRAHDVLETFRALQ